MSRLDEDDFIGQTSFLNVGHEPQSASVYVSDDFEAQPYPMDEIQQEYDKLSATMKNMIDNTATYISAITASACKLLETV